MTNEKIKNAIKGIDSVCEDHQFNIGCFDKCETDGRYCFVKIAKESLEKQNKYRWHDLRKDPNDLPKDFYSVLICLRGFEGREAGVTIAMHNSELNIWGSWSCSYKDYEVSAWREIEPFGEVE